jgi:hypothetical protein
MSYFDKIEILARHHFAIREKLKIAAPDFEHYFIHLCRSRRTTLRNPNKLNVKEFTILALGKIITSIALFPDDDIMQNVCITTIKENFKMDQDTANHLLEECMILYENENIKSLYKEMKKYKDGLLKRDQYDEAMKIYRRFMKPTDYKKKNKGEVFTPFECIHILLDQIPDYVWKNPNSTFFDPSAGMGGFLVIIYRMLMASLSDVFINRKDRHNHIIKNMLFAAEIDASNVAMMRQIFGSDLHIFHGDTITQFNARRHFGVNNFTVLVGNPPFEKSQQKQTRKNAGDSLWIDFVDKSFSDWLAPNGIFAMLLPPGWRKASDQQSRTKDLWKVMSRDNTIKFIRMFDDKEAKKVFDGHVSIRFDLVVVLKQKLDLKTVIEGTDKKFYQKCLKKLPFLPSGNLNYWFRLSTMKGPKCNVLYRRGLYGTDKHNKSVQETKDSIFKYPLINTICKDTITYRYTDKKNEEGGFGVPKVIFNRRGAWNAPILDLDGKYGMTQDTFGIVVDSRQQGLAIKKYFTPERLAMWGDDLNWSTSQPSQFWKLFRDIPKNFYNL